MDAVSALPTSSGLPLRDAPTRPPRAMQHPGPAAHLADGRDLRVVDLVWAGHVVLQVHLLRQVHLRGARLHTGARKRRDARQAGVSVHPIETPAAALLPATSRPAGPRQRPRPPHLQPARPSPATRPTHLEHQALLAAVGQRELDLAVQAAWAQGGGGMEQPSSERMSQRALDLAVQAAKKERTAGRQAAARQAGRPSGRRHTLALRSCRGAAAQGPARRHRRRRTPPRRLPIHASRRTWAQQRGVQRVGAVGGHDDLARGRSGDVSGRQPVQ